MRFLLAPLFAAVLSAQTGITADDYFRFATPGDPQISPDGKRVAYTVSRVDTEKNRRQTSLWMTAADGRGTPELLASAPASSPRWSPDGRFVSFLAAREGGRTQLWLLPLSGGEARRLTDLAEGVSGCQWSPDSTRLVCVSRTGRKKSPSDVRHYTRSRYKFNDSGWFDTTRAHLFVIDARTGAARQLTDGDEWNDGDPQWSPDSKSIAFVSDRTGKEFDLGRNSDVWVIPAAGGSLTRISTSPEPDSSPRWSPSGTELAFTGRECEECPMRIYRAPAQGGTPREAAANLDQTISDLSWAEGGKALFFTSGVRGETHLYRVDAATGAVRPVTSGPRSVRQYDLHESGRLVFLSNDFEHADELHTRTLSDPQETPLTSLNADFWKQRSSAKVERVSYKAADGWDIDGFLVKPLGWEPGKKYPMVLSIHGGPAGMYGVDWYHEFQVYAAKGWAVFFTNPRGSTGYGHKFERGVKLEWGGKAYTDIMSGVDEVLKRNPWIDRDRLGVTGGSYGGFMTNWITTQTQLFKAAVTLRCISNFISDEGTRDGAFGHDRDFGGTLFRNFDLYWHYSPLKHSAKVKTPTLVLHSENDFRTPLEQGEQWFRALQHHGVPSEFVIFPRENHNLTRTGEPKHLVESLLWQTYWFERYLDGNTRAKRPNE